MQILPQIFLSSIHDKFFFWEYSIYSWSFNPHTFDCKDFWQFFSYSFFLRGQRGSRLEGRRQEAWRHLKWKLKHSFFIFDWQHKSIYWKKNLVTPCPPPPKKKNIIQFNVGIWYWLCFICPGDGCRGDLYSFLLSGVIATNNPTWMSAKYKTGQGEDLLSFD